MCSRPISSCCTAHWRSHCSTSGVTRIGGWETGVTSFSSTLMVYFGSWKQPRSSYCMARRLTQGANLLKKCVFISCDTCSPNGHLLNARYALLVSASLIKSPTPYSVNQSLISSGGGSVHSSNYPPAATNVASRQLLPDFHAASPPLFPTTIALLPQPPTQHTTAGYSPASSPHGTSLYPAFTASFISSTTSLSNF